MARFCIVALLSLAAVPAGAGDLVLGPGFSPDDLAQLAAVLSDAVAFPQLAEAAPLGLVGFHAVVAAGGPQVSTRAAWWNRAMRERVVGNLLVAPRALVRKGLPRRWDAGMQVGKVFGVTFWGAELAWGLMDGGVLLPAVGLAGSYCRLEDAPVTLSVEELRLSLSKGFAVLTPFGSFGYRRERASAALQNPVPGVFSVVDERLVAAAGVVVGAPPLRLLAEVRQGAALGFFVGVGVGL